MMMATRARIRRGVMLLVLTAASCAYASSGSPRAEPRGEPSTEELNGAFFAQGAGAWQFTPASAEATRALRTTTAWDVRRVETLSVRARIVQRQHHALRLRWLVTSRLGFYAAVDSTPVPSIGTEALVTARLLPSGAALVPVGHQRPWDSLAAAEVTVLALRAEVSGSSQPLSVELGDPQVRLTAAREGEAVERRVVDLRVERPPSDIDAAAMLVFRVDPLPDDPFSPDAEGDVCIRLPDGREAPAFLDQPQILQRLRRWFHRAEDL